MGVLHAPYSTASGLLGRLGIEPFPSQDSTQEVLVSNPNTSMWVRGTHSHYTKEGFVQKCLPVKESNTYGLD